MSKFPSIDPNVVRPITIEATGETWPYTVFLKNVINHPNIEIGDFTYYNDHRDNIKDYKKLIAPYIYDHSPEKLIIGKFVQIAHGTQFITSSASHQMDGISTYPFAIFGKEWSKLYKPRFPNKGNTKVENDVWFGHESLIMPAVQIGSGAIIGSRSVVTKDVPPYTIVAGNPAKIIKQRFSDKQVKQLLKISWWNWPYDIIEKNIQAITNADIEILLKINDDIDL